jgi:hypothetical protein
VSKEVKEIKVDKWLGVEKTKLNVPCDTRGRRNEDIYSFTGSGEGGVTVATLHSTSWARSRYSHERLPACHSYEVAQPWRAAKGAPRT